MFCATEKQGIRQASKQTNKQTKTNKQINKINTDNKQANKIDQINKNKPTS
jgi:hypothetical protein